MKVRSFWTLLILVTSLYATRDHFVVSWIWLFPLMLGAGFVKLPKFEAWKSQQNVFQWVVLLLLTVATTLSGIQVIHPVFVVPAIILEWGFLGLIYWVIQQKTKNAGKIGFGILLVFGAGMLGNNWFQYQSSNTVLLLQGLSACLIYHLTLNSGILRSQKASQSAFIPCLLFIVLIVASPLLQRHWQQILSIFCVILTVYLLTRRRLLGFCILTNVLLLLSSLHIFLVFLLIWIAAIAFPNRKYQLILASTAPALLGYLLSFLVPVFPSSSFLHDFAQSIPGSYELVRMLGYATEGSKAIDRFALHSWLQQTTGVDGGFILPLLIGIIGSGFVVHRYRGRYRGQYRNRQKIQVNPLQSTLASLLGEAAWIYLGVFTFSPVGSAIAYLFVASLFVISISLAGSSAEPEPGLVPVTWVGVLFFSTRCLMFFSIPTHYAIWHRLGYLNFDTGFFLVLKRLYHRKIIDQTGILFYILSGLAFGEFIYDRMDLLVGIGIFLAVFILKGVAQVRLARLVYLSVHIFITFSKGFSPQFLLWLTCLIPLCQFKFYRTKDQFILIAFSVCVLMTSWIFDQYSSLGDLDSYLWHFLLLRNALMVAIAGVLAADLFLPNWRSFVNLSNQ